MASTLASFDPFIKDNFTKEKTPLLVNENHPFLDMLGEPMEVSGDPWVVPAIDHNPQGYGGTLAKAQAGSSQTSGGNIGGFKWTVSMGDYAAVVEIGDKVIAASRNDVGAFFQNKKEEIEGLYRGWGDIFESYMLRDGGHSLGSFTISSGVCTLVNKQDIRNFETGQILDVSANDGTSTAHVIIASAGLGYVVAVNYNTGVFTVAATSGGTAATPTNWTGTMYAFRTGDFGGDTSPNRIVFGYGSFCPAADPSATSFEGVVRTVDIVKRSGVRLVAADVAGMGIEQRLKKLATKMSSRGKPGKKVLIHDEQWLQLATSFEARGNRPIDGKTGIFSYPKLQMASPKGVMDIFASSFMPVDAAYMFDPEAIRFATYDGFPKVINGDGLQMLRKATTNDYEFRLHSYPGYVHRIPPATGRCPLQVPS